MDLLQRKFLYSPGVNPLVVPVPLHLCDEVVNVHLVVLIHAKDLFNDVLGLVVERLEVEVRRVLLLTVSEQIVDLADADNLEAALAILSIIRVFNIGVRRDDPQDDI